MNNSAAWADLLAHFETIAPAHMRDWFAQDPERAQRFSLNLDDLYVDFSKNLITDETLKLLLALAEEREVKPWIERQFSGERINHTEKRAVLHTALRNRSDEPVRVDGKDVMPEVRSELARMGEFSRAIREGEWLGYSGLPITDVVNLGTGGSHLGPLMASEALRPYCDSGCCCHFVSNIDGSDLTEVLKQVDPATTLFIIASKSFITEDTMTNAHSARRWFVSVASEEAIERHFVAVSDNIPLAAEFGIPESNLFKLWDWVGGRFSLWSAIGLPLAIAIGMDRFEEFLEGGWEMDQHFRNEPLESNIPVVLALIGIWYRNFYAAASLAVSPYDQYLSRLPAYLQQADMESNGKSVRRNGQRVNYFTGPIIWGEPGTNGQHAFYQLIHQGTPMVPVDFILPLQSHNPLGDHHRLLMANCLAQAEALMMGQTEQQALKGLKDAGHDEDETQCLLPHKIFDGNHPSNLIMFDKLTPKNLGRLIAMYEHKIFVQGVIWDINSYDQWGVELGKTLAKVIAPELSVDAESGTHDGSTAALIQRIRERAQF